MTIKEQVLLYAIILIVLSGFVGTSYSCRRQEINFQRTMHEKGFCYVLFPNTNVWVWRPCDPPSGGK